MLQAEYIRDMHNNYIVLRGMKENCSAYGTKMLLNNTIPGLLKAELRCIDHMDLFYYDITSKKSVAVVYENKALNYDELKRILTGILNIIENSGEYLLSEKGFIIDPNYVFIDTASQDIELCYLAGREENIQDQLSRFMEFLMNNVDYQDEAAVILIYAMYKESKEVDCTFEKLLRVLNKKSNEPRIKKITVDNEDYTNNRKGLITSEKYRGPEVNQVANDLQKDRDNRNNVQSRSFQNQIFQNQKFKNRKSPNRKFQSRQFQGHHFQSHQFQSQESQNRKSPNHKFQNKKRKNRKQNSQISRNSDIKSLSSLYQKIQSQFENFINKWLGRNDSSVKKAWSAVNLPEEVEGEREIHYFGCKTYLLAILSILGEGLLFILALKLKLLHNSFGTHIDMIKFLCCILILGSMEAYILMKLFDPNNKLVRIKTDVEYIDPDQDGDMIYEGDKIQSEMSQIEPNQFEINNSDLNQDETQLLWVNPDDSQQDKTVILSQVLPQKLYYLAAENSDTEIPVNQFPFVIGKLREKVNLTIEDISVSRRHAKITKEGEDIFLTDLNSTNGTFINGIKLEVNKPYLITDRDEISFSQAKYTWEVNTTGKSPLY